MARMFQELCWQAIKEGLGEKRYKSLYKLATQDKDRYYPSRKYDGYHAQYIDKLEMKYIYSELEKRENLLNTSLRSLLKKTDAYYKTEKDILEAAMEYGVDVNDIRLTGIEYPEDIEW